MKKRQNTDIERFGAPTVWDGFGFYRDPEDALIKFYFFDDITQQYGDVPGDPDMPPDRVGFHVILSSKRKNRIHIEIPFTSSFLDAFVYAKRIAHMGFTGIMIKQNKYSPALAIQFLKEIMLFHHSEHGFVMENEQGVDVFYAGKKKEKVENDN
jgi:hypothetical protein